MTAATRPFALVQARPLRCPGCGRRIKQRALILEAGAVQCERCRARYFCVRLGREVTWLDGKLRGDVLAVEVNATELRRIQEQQAPPGRVLRGLSAGAHAIYRMRWEADAGE